MLVEVTFLTRRGRDAIMRKSQSVTCEELKFGRGSDNEVQLADIRIGLSAAVLVRREHDFVFQQSGDTVLKVDGSTGASLVVRPGDRVELGPYEVRLTEAPEGFDAALTVELVQPLGDSLQRLAAANRIGLDKTGFSKRRMSWTFFWVCVLGCLVVPLVAFGIDNGQSWLKAGAPTTLLTLANMTWNVGELSNTHRTFAHQCAMCHETSFSRVPDSACLDCHRNIGGHVQPAVAPAGAAAAASPASPAHRLAQTPCGDCHREHRGLRGLVRQDANLCVSCHGSIAETAPQFDVRDVSGFPAGHPQFRVTVVADAAKPAFARAELGSTPKPADRPNLKFSHAAHLVEKGFLTPQGQKRMVCADCHVPEPGGQGFMPITYKGQCQSCHDLKFDAELPWREVPHGDDLGVRAAVEDFYAHVVLQRGVPPSAPPAEPARRVPGAPVATPAPAPKPDALTWAREKADEALTLIYNDKRGCAYCHVMENAADHRVAPVFMRTRFLPNASFNHTRHAATDCADCHDSRHSETSADVLVPGIDSCTGCHGPARASFRAQSQCVTCHAFHRPDFGPMRRTAAVSP